ncbi:MAG: nitroreductase family protein [Clostridiales Family XIII bacterium]|nr:nitroreductase family protein [Clostridia bacterium]MDY3011626.1 nitroreductase family protein [Clostridiales Family XIII bacterium]
MNVTEAIRSRRSIRKYKKGVVIPQEHFQRMLEAAMMAPSAGNTKPWEFLVVENRGILEKLTEINPYARMLRTASAAIVICAKPELQTGICSGFWPQDCGAAAENLILQAEDLGYGTCWCGMYPIQHRVEKAQALLRVTSIPYALIAVGVPDQAPEARGFFDPSRVRYIK